MLFFILFTHQIKPPTMHYSGRSDFSFVLFSTEKESVASLFPHISCPHTLWSGALLCRIDINILLRLRYFMAYKLIGFMDGLPWVGGSSIWRNLPAT